MGYIANNEVEALRRMLKAEKARADDRVGLNDTHEWHTLRDVPKHGRAVRIWIYWLDDCRGFEYSSDCYPVVSDGPLTFRDATTLDPKAGVLWRYSDGACPPSPELVERSRAEIRGDGCT